MINKYARIIKDYCYKNYYALFRDSDGLLRYPYIVPGSCYDTDLWDWDSWLTDVALRQIVADMSKDENFIFEYEKGCVLNFLMNTDGIGKMPIMISPKNYNMGYKTDGITNMHKPCIAQHIAFIMKNTYNDTSWFCEKFSALEKFLLRYKENNKHICGLYFWTDDFMIGVDNDPCTFYRPNNSSASIYLNCLMYKELSAMEYICEKMGLKDKKAYYHNEAEELKKAVQDNCWDERMGFYFSADLNLLAIDEDNWLHKGAPKHWDCLIQRIEVWTGFMAMWSEIATKEQAKRIVQEHFYNEKTFSSPFGIRSLSKLEKMYVIKGSGNPSCWLGPIWGIVNYMVFSGLLKYGYEKEARDIAEKTVLLFGRDIESCGAMHEYYDPETGNPVIHEGFQSWNLLALNMIAYLEDRNRIEEF